MTQTIYQPVIAVTGATGAQGGATARALLRHGSRVRALTRRPSSTAAEELRGLGAEVAYADFDDRAGLDAALAGADALFTMSTLHRGDAESVADAEVRQAISLLDAAAASGTVRHIVFTSAANADRGTGIPTSRPSTASNSVCGAWASRGRSSPRGSSWTTTPASGR